METKTLISPFRLISSITREVFKGTPDHPYRFADAKVDFGPGSSTPICLKIRSTSFAEEGGVWNLSRQTR